jgi:hypothetical protein
MILGAKPESAAPRPCPAHLELTARIERIEKCVEAIEKALAAPKRTRSKASKAE